MPDCFGFSYTLPTIARHCGLTGFSTQKLQWRENPFYGTSKIPFQIGYWEGVDGSKILSALDGKKYRTVWSGEDLTSNKDMLEVCRNSPYGVAYRYYGMGDRGGAPTISSARSVERSLHEKGDMKMISATSDMLFQDLMKRNTEKLSVFKGELLMDVHGTGCYTSQAAVKKYNRRNETLGDAAERCAVIAQWLGVMDYPGEKLREIWTRFLWHQFHDDITGTSIPNAYRFTWNDQLIAQSQFASVLTDASEAICSTLNTDVKGIPIVVYNPLSIPRKDIVEVTIDYTGKPGQGVVMVSPDGNKTMAQVVSADNGKIKTAVLC
ncbi:MAG: hypothetical protein HC830_06490 [Bacteroidetes bacterium]|nr:hypothetical protein [Bacteroidota bacterium]